MAEYSYTDTDFVATTNGVDVTSLQDVIWSSTNISTLFMGTKVSIPHSGDSTYTFVFEAAITTAEETELDSIVAAHTGMPPEPSALDKEKEKAKLTIDNAAGEARARYITVAPGQDAVYIEKEMEANAHKDAGYPADLTPYPFIEANMNAQGGTATEATDLILATATSWKALAAQIEEIRLDYKGQVDVETDQGTVKALCCKAIALLNAI